jgi:hypothetical protein
LDNKIDNKEFDLKLQTLLDCQIKNNIDDCMKCDKIIKCIIRKDYVDSVYTRLRDGGSGGFEF